MYLQRKGKLTKLLINQKKNSYDQDLKICHNEQLVFGQLKSKFPNDCMSTCSEIHYYLSFIGSIKK